MPEPTEGPKNLPPGMEADLQARQRRAARRIARVRLWVMLGTAAVVAAALIIVLRLRVPLPPLPAVSRPGQAEPLETVGFRPPMPTAPAPETNEAQMRRLLGRIDFTAAAAAERWNRSMLLLAASQARDSSRLAEALSKARTAAVLAESSAAALAELAGELERLDGDLRGAPPGAGFRLRAAQAAALAYVRGLEEDARFRIEYVRAALAALEAFAAGDEAESEVKTNVANSYWRRSELKQRALARLSEALDAARQALEREQGR
jgi:ribosomal protein L39E